MNEPLHLCNNPRHLLFALLDSLSTRGQTRILYLEDDLPMPAEIRAALRAACPAAEISFTTDRQEMARFACLPRWVPEVIRRNLRPGRMGKPVRPAFWQGSTLGAERFATGYLYHSGFFMAKVAAGLCDRVILRESGLNNYTTIRVPTLKALLRLLSGLSPFRQVWGEERWVDAIEVEHPDRLPRTVRRKARALSFANLRAAAPPAAARRLASAFCTGLPHIDESGPTALILTQPLDRQGFCSPADKIRLYQGIADLLAAEGYRIFVKNHPRDDGFALSGTAAVPRFFPIEAWPLLSAARFDLAVALCSASLSQQAGDIARTSIQLIPAPLFEHRHVPGWAAEIERALAALDRDRA